MGGAAVVGLDLRIRCWGLAHEPVRLLGKVEVAQRIGDVWMGRDVAVRRRRQRLQVGREHCARWADQLRGGGTSLPGGDRRHHEVSASFA